MKKALQNLFTSFVVFGMLLLAASPAPAQSLEKLLRRSQAVVQAQVSSINEEVNKHNVPIEIVTLQVKDVIAGEVSSGILRLDVPVGLIYDGPPVPKFNQGEEVIVALEQRDGNWAVFGNSLGKFRITGTTVVGSDLLVQQFKRQIKKVTTSEAAYINWPSGAREDHNSGTGDPKLGGEFSVINDPYLYGPTSGTIELQINPTNAEDKNGNPLSFNEVKAAVKRAVDTWNNSPHSYATFTVSSSEYSGARQGDNGVSTVTFENTTTSNAATDVRENNGIIDEVDLIFNNLNHWNTNTQYPSSYPIYNHNYRGNIGPVDLEDVAAHELGHGVGLAHVTSSSYTMHPTNYSLSQWWEKTYRRSLEDGDKAGKIYQAPSIPGSYNTQQIPKILLGAPPSISIDDNFTISSGQTFDIEMGTTLEILDYVDLKFNNPMTIGRGTIFKLGQNSNIIFNGQVTAQGYYTSDPVRFKRRDAGKRWGDVKIFGNGSTFDNVVFDGGRYLVSVGAQNVTFEDSRFKRGLRGISSWYTKSNNRSSFTLINSIVEYNDVGIVPAHADPEFRYVTVQNNDKSGVYLYDASVDVFYKSVVESNGDAYTRNGIEVLNGSDMYIFGPQGGGGYTRVAYNNSHEIEVSDGYAYLGYYLYDGGYNTVQSGSSGRQIYNATSNQVAADQTYWGVVSSCDCYGPVKDDYPLSSDHTSGSGADPFQVPSKTTQGQQPVAVAGTAEVPASTRAVKMPEARVVAASQKAAAESRSAHLRLEKIQEDMQALRSKLDEQPYSAESARRLRKLYQLQLLDRKNELGEKETTTAILARWRKKLSTSDELTGKAEENVQQASEVAALASIRDAMFSEDYEEAKRLYSKYGALIEGNEHRRSLLLKRVSLLSREGRYDDALAVFYQFQQIESASGIDPAVYDIIKEDLLARGATPRVAEASTVDIADANREGAGNTEQLDAEAFRLKQSFPNPFSSKAVVPFGVKEQANVKIVVYDVLGRRVATLTDRVYEPGQHKAQLAADGLTSGTYIIRARMRSTATDQVHTFVHQISLVK